MGSLGGDVRVGGMAIGFETCLSMGGMETALLVIGWEEVSE
jgi:hypothetical protein